MKLYTREHAYQARVASDQDLKSRIALASAVMVKLTEIRKGRKISTICLFSNNIYYLQLKIKNFISSKIREKKNVSTFIRMAESRK